MKCREKKWRGAFLIRWPCFNRPCPVCGLVPAVRTAMIDPVMESDGGGGWLHAHKLPAHK